MTQGLYHFLRFFAEMLRSAQPYPSPTLDASGGREILPFSQWRLDLDVLGVFHLLYQTPLDLPE